MKPSDVPVPAWASWTYPAGAWRTYQADRDRWTELLTRIEASPDQRILAAVVELHEPSEPAWVKHPDTRAFTPVYQPECNACEPGAHAESGVEWPCVTLCLIASELGVWQ